MTAPRVISLLMALAAQTPGAMEAAGMDAGKDVRRIEIEPQQPRFALGAGIGIRVTFVNPTSTAWKLERPETSSSVRVSYRLAGNGERAVTRFSLSRKSSREVKLPNGKSQIVQVVPPKTEIEIKPGAKHEFVVDLGTGWTEDLVPGTYEVWVEDVGQGLKSGLCTFSLTFSRDSVPALLETAAKEDESPAKRKWCVCWLQMIQPDFDLKLKGEADTPEAKKAAMEANATAIRRFREHWEKVKASAQIDALFSQPGPSRKETER